MLFPGVPPCFGGVVSHHSSLSGVQPGFPHWYICQPHVHPTQPPCSSHQATMFTAVAKVSDLYMHTFMSFTATLHTKHLIKPFFFLRPHFTVQGWTKMNDAAWQEYTTVVCQCLTKAKGSWSRNGGRLDWRGGVETSHQQTIKWNTGRDGYYRRGTRTVFIGSAFTKYFLFIKHWSRNCSMNSHSSHVPVTFLLITHNINGW